MTQRGTLIGIASVVCLFGATTMPAQAGNPTPPPGPVIGTMKTLDEVEPRIAISNANTPGDVDSTFRITQPGSYYLTDGFAVLAGRHGIEIAASNVTVDLEGHTIDGTPGSLDGISLDGTHNAIVIRDGHIDGMGGSGIAGELRYGTIESVDIRLCGGYGIDVGATTIVRDCVVRTTVLGGIQVSGGGLVMDSLVSQVTGGIGIEGAIGVKVVNCAVFGASSHGIVVGEESQVSGCKVRFSGGNGVQVGPRGSISDSLIAQSTQWGMELQTGSVASRCQVELNTGTGIVGRIRSKVEDCTVMNNGSSGIYVEDESSVIGNTVTGNGGAQPTVYGGIVVPLAACVVTDNELRINGTNLIVTGTGNTIVRNISSFGLTAGYDIGPSNFVGALVSDPSLAGPWDNIDN